MRVETAYRQSRTSLWLLVGSWLAILQLAACKDDLGACDESAAQALVFDERNRVATAGQALTHDGCGSGAFCHSAEARGANRKGVPKGLDFDMLPEPTGWKTLRELRESLWDTVDERTMPPPGKAKRLVRDSGWSYDYPRGAAPDRLPSITSKEGREIFRNWLSCGAPTVRETNLVLPDAGGSPPDAGGPLDSGPKQGPDWSEIYRDLIAPSCVTGCHTPGGQYAQLDLSELCSAYAALLATAPCGQARVVPGDESSLLVQILEDAQPGCNSARRMPLVPPYFGPEDQGRVAAWVASGAEAESCP